MIRIHRHAACPGCARTAAITTSLDWFGLVATSIRPPAGPPLLPGEIAVQDLESGEWHRGVAAVRQICFHIPMYLPFGLLLLVPPVARWFERLTARRAAACPVPVRPPQA